MLPIDLVPEHGPYFETARGTYLYEDGYEVRFHYGGARQPVHQPDPQRKREWQLLEIADLEARIAADSRKVEHGGAYGTLHEQLDRLDVLKKRREACIANLLPPAGATPGQPPLPLQAPKTYDQIAREQTQQVLRKRGFYEPLMPIPAHLREPEELPPEPAPAKEKKS
jgi:hypothetical protein